MLKGLELHGFKSFADPCRLDFPPGVTAVVGPNGSGKSNVVDAIKWVLGEQSVRSLRGKEMVDVIFNGSSSRKALNTAEATLTLDNSQGLLAIDAPLVQITRRIFRSGEAEYLINRQACRLRDIRELFAGTGMATQAYAVIEQGKVDALLQAAPKDRRLIFEEAAGISRFKARKQETERRLERVTQNLTRLADIVGEVGSRLKSVQAQAQKALQYRECSARLRELRLATAAADYARLSQERSEVAAAQKLRRDELGSLQSLLEAKETQLADAEVDLAEAERDLRAEEGRLSQIRERLASLEASRRYSTGRETELDAEIATALADQLRQEREQRRLQGELQARLKLQADSATEVAEFSGRARQLEELFARQLAEQTAASQAVTQAEAALASFAQGKIERERQVHALLAQQQVADGGLVGLQQRSHELTTELERLTQGVAAADARELELQRRMESAQVELSAAEHALELGEKEAQELQSQLAAADQELTALTERADVLSEVLHQHDAATLATRELLKQSKEPGRHGAAFLPTLLADRVRVTPEAAYWIEAALGSRAQALLPASGTDRDKSTGKSPLDEWAKLFTDAGGWPGRVKVILPLSESSIDGAVKQATLPDLRGTPGIVGACIDFVQVEAEDLSLVTRLLAGSWVVEDIAVALALYQRYPGVLRLVTRQGELVAPDGVVTAGPLSALAGTIVRSVELNAVRQRVAAVSEQKGVLGGEWERLRVTLAQHKVTRQAAEQTLRELERANWQKLAEQAAEGQSLSRLQKEADRLRERQQVMLAEQATRQAQIAHLQEQLANQTRVHDELEHNLVLARQALQNSLTQGEAERAAAAEAKVQWARKEEQAAQCHQQLAATEQLLEQVQTAARLQATRLQQLQNSRQQAQLTALQSGQHVARETIVKEALSQGVRKIWQALDRQRNERLRWQEEARQIRLNMQQLEQEQHQAELALADREHQRTKLAERIQEDYELELASLPVLAEMGLAEKRQEFEQEMERLRRRLNHLGGVNLEALGELDVLQARHETLSAQYADLDESRDALQRIIVKINTESRRLFSQTLQEITRHFQGMFRKLFSGGTAEILLDPDEDILEAGIEIVAKPPGKELRSMSLMSGGEKTLTCVALLLAIFKTRPSPFCILDEVDAALDEANIQRFVDVLKEFLSTTQFVMVTHSKKTMAAADHLYGVTMQESGISKLVSVQWSKPQDAGQSADTSATKETTLLPPSVALKRGGSGTKKKAQTGESANKRRKA